MGILRSIESRLERVVEGSVGRLFRASVAPVELARKLAKELEEGKVVSVTQTYAPNEYTIYLSPRDRTRFADFEASLRNELASYLAEHARRAGYVMPTRPRVRFETESSLHTGIFGISTALVRDDDAPSDALPARRPRTRPPRPPRPGCALDAACARARCRAGLRPSARPARRRCPRPLPVPPVPEPRPGLDSPPDLRPRPGLRPCRNLRPRPDSACAPRPSLPVPEAEPARSSLRCRPRPGWRRLRRCAEPEEPVRSPLDPDPSGPPPGFPAFPLDPEPVEEVGPPALRAAAARRAAAAARPGAG